MGIRLQQRLTRLSCIALMVVILLIALFPSYWMAITAFRPKQEINAAVPSLWPTQFTLGNFRDLFENTAFLSQFRNSLVIASSVTLLAIGISSLAAYSLTRLRYRGRDAIAAAVFLTYVFPSSLLFVPLFLVMVTFKLHESMLGVILAYLTFTVPFATWMLKSYFSSIPVDLEEAALVDGCNRVQSLVRIVLPLAAPGIAAAAVFSFTLALNEYLYAFILLSDPNKYTVPLGLAYFMHTDILQWGRMMSASLIYTLPALVLYVAAQRFLVAGLTAGSVKA